MAGLTEHEMLMVALEHVSEQIAQQRLAIGRIAGQVADLERLLTKTIEGAAIQVSTQAVEETPPPNRYGR